MDERERLSKEAEVLGKLKSFIDDNKDELGFESSQLMYHCEEWRVKPKPTLVIYFEHEGSTIKLGDLEINN